MTVFYAVFGGLGLLILAYAALRTQLRARAWRSSLRALAEVYGLEHVRPKGVSSKIYDYVHGQCEGFDVKIHVEDLAEPGSDNSRLAVRVEIDDVLHWGVDLSAAHGRAASGWSAGKRNESLDPDVAAALVHGLRIEHGDFIWTSTDFPRRPSDLRERFDWLLSMARRVHTPR